MTHRIPVPIMPVLGQRLAPMNARVEGEELADTDPDEPPERPRPSSNFAGEFKRTLVRQPTLEQQESLLTKALQAQTLTDSESCRGGPLRPCRRCSTTSTFSFSSTTEHTCDTGLTTPARTGSPGPHMRDGLMVGSPEKPSHLVSRPPAMTAHSTASAVLDPQQKKNTRTISFACADAKPSPIPRVDAQPHREATKAPTHRTIKFAASTAPPRSPSLALTTPVENTTSGRRRLSFSESSDSPATVRTARLPSPERRRQSTKLVTVSANVLKSECARFHEFASGEPQDDDWIHQDIPIVGRKMTVNDTLAKEIPLRKLGQEVEEEEEEELENEEADTDDGNEDDEEEDDDDSEDDDNEDDEDDEEDDNGTSDVNGGDAANDYEVNLDHVEFTGYESDVIAADGYKTDNEIGFASSDDEGVDDGCDWWPVSSRHPRKARFFRPSQSGHRSDSSDYTSRKARSGTAKGLHRKPVSVRPESPELPDSTDFVCGTLDEDRPLEEAYMSRLAALQKSKLRLIPQDIDPSFPTSEPEDEDDAYKPSHHSSHERKARLRGDIDGLENLGDGACRRLKATRPSPPTRYHSPAPPRRSREQSPRRLAPCRSPRRLKSPAPPRKTQVPLSSPVRHSVGIVFEPLATRPAVTRTKSLPKPPAVFPHTKTRKARGHKGTHVRGAIDIVKGLEQKRQRRREKYNQKYCTRARKEKATERRPPPGQGAERMREIGLLMAGKIGRGNYVLSV